MSGPSRTPGTRPAHSSGSHPASPPGSPLGSPPGERPGSRLLRAALGYALAAGVIWLCWAWLAAGVAGAVLPSPQEAFGAFFQALPRAQFWGHFWASARRAALGMALAWGTGFPLGVLMGGSRRADALLAPMLFLTFPIPKIVLLPVFLIVLGLGDASKTAMIAAILGYQVLVTVRDGVQGVHPRAFEVVRGLGGNAWHVAREVLVPAALPYGFTALRLGSGVSVAVLFFVESFATQRGLGYLIMDGWGALNYRDMFVGIIGMSVLGVALYEAVNVLERAFCRWRPARRS